MSILKFQNPASRDGQADRVNEIEAAYANDLINKTQFDDLMSDEQSTRNLLRLKRVGLAVLLGMIGLLFLSSL